ncbi:ATP-binding cassette domain-containing protein [Phaeobacter sp.]|uniref:ATP-binding cassette domain-containing protein n=1 Tax=Phaeobacter sp. TaxID=1902409 RepID=UPI0025EE57E0|nr:ATP-binding cassette domain-containing protein [Phaeobacter sp.]
MLQRVVTGRIDIAELQGFGPNSPVRTLCTTADCQQQTGRAAARRRPTTLMPRMDVVSNVLRGVPHPQTSLSELFRLYPREDIDRAIDCLDRFGMSAHASKRVDALSQGQKVRVLMASALMCNPSVIRAHDLLAALDPMNVQDAMETLRHIQRDDRRAVFISLPSAQLARRYCDWIVFLRAGQIVFDGPSEVFSDATVDDARAPGRDPAPDTGMIRCDAPSRARPMCELITLF